MASTQAWYELFRSVELIWLIWIGAMSALVHLLRRASLTTAVKEFQLLWTDESGAAYTLSYVFSFPIYMLLVCTVIETSLVLVVKVGTMYASYAGARSAVVWLPSKPEVAATKIRLAVVHALTPFAEGTPVHTKRLGMPAKINSAGISYHTAYQRYAENRAKAPMEFLARKYSVAERATTISWDPSDPVEDQDVTVTVTYRMPLHIPGAARVLGHPQGFYPITSKSTLQNEGPKREAGFDDQKPLGIDYQSLP